MNVVRRGVRALASVRLFFLLAFALMLAMAAGTLVPQNEPRATYLEMFSERSLRAIDAVGGFDLFHSPWFVALLALLAANTLACLSLRLSGRPVRRLPWGALLSHAAVLVILAGGVVSGVVGERGTLPLRVGEQGCCVPSGGPDAGREVSIHLPFEVRLADFNVEYYGSGQHFIELADPKEGWRERLEVREGGSYLVRDRVRLDVLKHLPDFKLVQNEKTGAWEAYSASSQFTNPALHIEVTASPKRRLWLFAKFPGFSHGAEGGPHLTYQYVPPKVKQFKSRIEIFKDSKRLAEGEASVNHPFKYGGYTFYQSGYDPDDASFSSFQVAKDPGISLVYAGFILLPLGLAVSFYGKGRGAKAGMPQERAAA